MQDDSMVKLNDQFRQGETSFRWHNGLESRPARIESGSLPAYPPAVNPLLDWPSSKTLLHAILKKLERDASDQIMPNVNRNPGTNRSWKNTTSSQQPRAERRHPGIHAGEV